MKNHIGILVLIIALISQVNSQSILNTIGTGGTFKIKDNSATYFSLNQSNGYAEFNKSIKLSLTTDQNTGVIYKESIRFIHDYAPAGTNGKNVFVGLSAGNFTMSGTGLSSSYNTGMGYYALLGLTTGSFNSSFGSLTLADNTTGSNNSAFGYTSLGSNTTGLFNSSFGNQSMQENLTGSHNSAFGNLSLYLNTGGNNNSAFGSAALQSNTSGSNNSAFGFFTLNKNTTASFNSAFGIYSLYTNTTGHDNNSFGYNSLYSNTTGNFNCSFGRDNLFSNTSGSYNAAFGHQSLYSNSIGINNSAFGISALYSNIDGDYNSAFGYSALSGNTTGNYNTAIGYSSGDAITTGSYNIVIGYGADVPSGTANNQIRIGGAGITYAGVQVAWTITSDKRWKSNIAGLNYGLNFLTKLRPVSYTRNNDEKQKTEYGFIAQELEQALKECGIENSGMLTIDDSGMYQMRYNDLFAPIVKAIQELKDENDKLKKEIGDLKSLEERLTLLELTVLKDAVLKETKTAGK